MFLHRAGAWCVNVRMLRSGEKTSRPPGGLPNMIYYAFCLLLVTLGGV